MLSGAYLYAWPSPTLLYIAAVLLHVALGIATAVVLVPVLKRGWSLFSLQERAGWSLVVLGTLLGLLLIFIGTSRPQWPWLYAHIGLMLAGVILLTAGWVSRRGWQTAPIALAAVLAAAGGLSAGAHYLRVTP